MAQRQDMREFNRPHVADFDEQMWPVNCAILILAGLVAGLIIARGSFTDDRVLYNASTHLIGVGLLVVLLFWGVWWLRGKMLHRLQLGIFLSLIVHFSAAWALDVFPFSVPFFAERIDRPGGWSDTVEEVVGDAPDYHWTQVEQPGEEQPYEAPVQAAVPETVAPTPEPPKQEDLTHSVPEAALPRAASPDLLPGGPGAEPDPKELRRAGASVQAQVAQPVAKAWERQAGREVPLPQGPAEAAPVAAAPEPGRTIEADPSQVARQAPAGQPGAAGRPAPGDPGRAAAPAIARGEMPRRAGEGPGNTVAAQPQTPGRAERDVMANLPPAPGAAPAAQAGPPGEPGLAPGRPGDTSVAKASTKPVAGGPGSDEAGLALAGMTGTPQLPAGIARRAAPSQPQASGNDPIIARPGTLARADNGGINMPSTVLARAEDSTQAPAAWGGSPASRVEATSKVAVERTAGSQAPQGASIAAAGGADFGIGGGQRVTRTGMPRGAGERSPTVAPNSTVRRLARAPSGTSIGGMPSIEVDARPDVLSEPGPGDRTAPSALASSAPGRGGARESNPGSPARTVGVGLPVDGGVAGASGSGSPLASVGIAEIGRMPRPADASAAMYTGGIGEGGPKRPGRAKLGGGLPDATADAGGFATGTGGTGGGAGAGAGSGAVLGIALEGNVKGLEPGVAGLPGSIQTTVRMGALASTSDRGAPLPTAAGQRAAASQPRDGGSGLSPGMAGTLARTRTDGGANLPSAVVPTGQVAAAGGGGVMTLPGGATSSLQAGPVATIHRGAGAGVPFGRSSVPTGNAEAGSGSGVVSILPGTVNGRGTGVPSLRGGEMASVGASPMVLARSSTSGTGVPGGVAEGGAPASSGTAPSGPAAGAGGGSIEPGPSPVSTVIRAGATLPAVGTGAGGQPGGVSPHVGQVSNLPGIVGQVSNLPTATGPASNLPGAGPRRLSPGTETGSPVGVAGGVARATPNLGLPAGTAEPTEPAALVTSGAGLNPAAVATVGRGGGGTNPNGTGAGGTGLGGTGGGDGRGTGPGRTGLHVRTAGLGPDGLVEPSAAGLGGIPTRRGFGENTQVATASVTGRPALGRAGGGLAIEGSVKEPTPSFQHRGTGRRRGFGPGEGEGGGTNDKVLEVGLDWFARIQFPDGHWSIDKLPDGMKTEEAALGQMQSDTAATGLVLLTYLGGGYTHLDDKHRTLVRRGVEWLVKRQKPDGDLFVGGSKYTHLYSHGIAAMALCEAYGMTQDPELREAAQKAVDFIVRSQDLKNGGWRYEPGKESDTSVTGWQLMALKSGQMAGLTVPVETLRRINEWLNTAQNPQRDGRYRYNPHDLPDRADSHQPSLAMTAEAMLMRMYLGQRRDNLAVIQGAEHVKANLPEVGSTDRPQRDCYYWYYATQAMYQMQGEYWTTWNNRLRPLMEASQVKTGEWAGTWHPSQPIPDRWGHAGGRLYVTAMHLLMLEVEYRYLPLFQELSR